MNALLGLDRILVVFINDRRTPDIVIFGKALGNGYPITAVLGKDEVMDAAKNSFISSTFWSERIGPVAALKTRNYGKEKIGLK